MTRTLKRKRSNNLTCIDSFQWYLNKNRLLHYYSWVVLVVDQLHNRVLSWLNSSTSFIKVYTQAFTVFWSAHKVLVLFNWSNFLRYIQLQAKWHCRYKCTCVFHFFLLIRAQQLYTVSHTFLSYNSKRCFNVVESLR